MGTKKHVFTFRMENENFTGTTVDEPYELTAKITTNVNDVLTADDVINGGVPKAGLPSVNI